MPKSKVHQPTLVTPPLETGVTIQNYLESMSPLPIGDLTTDPLTHQPWWKYQTMYYHHLLRWHPDHPHSIDPTGLDPHLLTGQVARLTLVIRDLVLESQKGMILNYKKEIPKEITDILPLIQSLISLDFLTCIYTIFLPIMANTLPISAWNHLYDMLQLILATMKMHTICESGTQHQHKLYRDPTFSSFHDISIPIKLSNLITHFAGTIWKSDYRIIVNIPSDAWIQYGKGHMNLQVAHNFEQVAWVQISQFHAKDLKEAINQLTLFEEVSFSNQLWQDHKEKNQFKSTYLHLLYQCKVYAIIEQWILAESQRALSIEQNNQLATPRSAFSSPNYSNNANEPQTNSVINFTEEWDIDSSSPSDCDNA